MELLERLEISVLMKSISEFDNETKRIDSEYFRKQYLSKIQNLKSLKHERLTELGLIKGGKRLPLGEEFSIEGVPYIRAQDVKNNFIDYENSPKISNKLHLELINYQTSKNDVLITNVGNSIGDTGIVKFDLDKCNLTENAVKIISQKINPEFLFSFFQSKFGKFQIERETVGTAQPKLAIERIRKFIIPIISDNIQENIKSLIENSYLLKNKSQSFYFQAEEILLKEIGIQKEIIDLNPVKFTNYNVKSFKDSFGTTGRLDAEYYQKKYEDIIQKIKTQKYDTLKSITTINKSIEPGSNYYSNDEIGLPFMRISDFNKFGLTEPNKRLTLDFVKDNQDKIEELMPTKNTILFSKDGTVGIAHQLREDFKGVTSSAILHLKVKNEKEILPEYLTLTLNSKLVQMQAERDAGGSIIQHWRKEEIENVIIPIIDYYKQKEIAQLIEESFSLKKQSEHLLEVAKRAVEIAIEENEEVAFKYINLQLK